MNHMLDLLGLLQLAAYVMGYKNNEGTLWNPSIGKRSEQAFIKYHPFTSRQYISENK